MRLLLPFLVLAACTDGGEPQVDCSSYTLDIPSVRGELSGVYDTTGDRMVFFGGNQDVPVECAFGATDFVDETWEYKRECSAFRQIPTDEAPSRRGRHASTTDGEKMYIGFGRFREGTSGDYTLRRDVWAFDYATDEWERLSRGTGPSARTNTNMVELDGKLWVFGGNTSTNGGFFSPQADLWSFDLESLTWEEHQATGPRSRLFHAMATDGEMLYVFGGGDENAFLGPFLDDLWAYDPERNEWTEMLHDGNNGPAVPSDRFWAGMEYDPIGNNLVMFGGHDNTPLGNTNQVYRYSLDEGRWWRPFAGDTFANAAAGFCDFPADFVLQVEGSPERRNAAATAMTPSGELLLFGGKTDCGLVNDVWTFDMTSESWTENSPTTSGESCVRSNSNCTTLCF